MQPLLFATVFTILTTFATAKIRCLNDLKCISYIQDPGWTCPDNYEQKTITVPGFTKSTYCERACNKAEQNQCDNELCSSNSDQCTKSPKAVGICRKALETCAGPVKMSEEICTRDVISGSYAPSVTVPSAAASIWIPRRMRLAGFDAITRATHVTPSANTSRSTLNFTARAFLSLDAVPTLREECQFSATHLQI